MQYSIQTICMFSCILNIYGHILILVLVMLAFGFFGGYLNYLHNFDTNEPSENTERVRNKYIFLGIGAAFIVPLMLNMIQSNLITYDDQKCKPESYLIFAGFCLISAIFSRRFITTIGEKILETAKRAEQTTKENTRKIESTQREISSNTEKIEDVKLAIDLKNTENQTKNLSEDKSLEFLIQLADSYVTKTSIPGYTERLALKTEIARKMGELIIRHNFSKKELLDKHCSEGMVVALAMSIQLKPDGESLNILNELSSIVDSLFGKYKILDSYSTLARNSFINKSEAKDAYNLIVKFRVNADIVLSKNVDRTINIFKIIDPTIDPL